jgi:hypothetical protein
LGIRGGWKETEKIHKMFCKIIIGVQITAVNGMCVKE